MKPWLSRSPETVPFARTHLLDFIRPGIGCIAPLKRQAAGAGRGEAKVTGPRSIDLKTRFGQIGDVRGSAAGLG